jgi:hypothetical protein
MIDRLKYPERNLSRDDGEMYIFWDNFVYRSKVLAPLLGQKVDFQRYTSCHDDWLFSFRDNLRLHNGM